eukprot:scaffold2791_cov211-Ochromonas_danica.AAC.2
MLLTKSLTLICNSPLNCTHRDSALFISQWHTRGSIMMWTLSIILQGKSMHNLADRSAWSRRVGMQWVELLEIELASK